MGQKELNNQFLVYFLKHIQEKTGREYFMHVVRQISKDETSDWDKFVAQSPQAGLFQTLAWAQMLCDTDVQEQNLLPLVCVDENKIQGGMIVRYRTVSGKMLADLPAFGYNGPALAESLHPLDRAHTYSSYTVYVELLKSLTEKMDSIVLVNQPEIWDTRAFKFQSWHISAAYTHLWHCPDLEELWKRIHPDTQKSIQSVQSSLTVKTVEGDVSINKFIELSEQKKIPFGVTKIPASALRKRIQWMQDRDVCRLYAATDGGGNSVGMALAVLSRENRTSYLWDVVGVNPKHETQILPCFYFKIYAALAEQFCKMDLGPSNCRHIGEIKDQLGCQLTPIFNTKYQAKRPGR
jgi:hypothetical protein